MKRSAAIFLLALLSCGLLAVVERAPARSQQTRAQASLSQSLRSTLVYPEQRIALRMDHSHPAHVRLQCTRCHQDVLESQSARDLLVPREEACAPCHDDRLDREQPSEDACGYCHVGYDADTPLVVPASDFPTARLTFDHQLHARRGVACLRCHDSVQQAALATRSQLPTMEQCLECHGGARPTAATACSTCHETEPDGVLRTEYPEGQMNPPRWLGGAHHDRDFLVRHRWVAADEGALCASCHRERECRDCHDGNVRPPRVHANDFLSIHPVQARRDEPRCASCHSAQTFCGECHARLGLAMVSSGSVAAGARYHPPAERWVRGPAEHGREARRSMSACVSCHVENDCVRCHGAAGIGTGLSPHGPGFRARCGDILRRNARACGTCHGDLEALAGRCL